MTRTSLEEWLKDCLGRRLDKAGWTVVTLPEGALQISVDKGDGEVLIEEDGCTVSDAGKKPRILIASNYDDAPEGTYFEVFTRDARSDRLFRSISNAILVHSLRVDGVDREQSLRRRDYELKEIIEIGKSLSAQKDVDTLLGLILEKSRHLMGADAGSIYVVEADSDDGDKRRLRFKLSQNDSIHYESKEFVMPVSVDSIAGAAVVMKRSIDIPDVHNIPKEAPYKFDPTWDERMGYRTCSVMAVPMINQVGEVLGVVQLINKKINPSAKLLSPGDFDREVIPMDARGKDLVETLASQAGVAMDNAFLYAEIKRIFEGFVRASVHTIEQRDPTTSGHSFRVASLTRGLAEVVHNQSEGKYADVKFDDEILEEIETAALLHDFGKVGVREEVLVKAKKLYPPNLKIVRARFDFIRRSIENDHLQRRLMMIEEGTPEEELAILDHGSGRALSEIDECWRIISSANEPTILPEGDFKKVEEVASRNYFDLNGKRQPYLEAEELKALLVAKGSLTPEELEEIRSHAAHTISFLKKIPWGKSMRNLPLYAGAHHEKLNGTGYPYGLKEDEIPLPAKIMAVADIFDALTAADRPYKKAVSLERALQILDFEVKDHHIDEDLVSLFKEKEVYRVLNEPEAASSEVK
jgi:HD-GYP domain-containing protein (c-di-GMP phosphodiesterase class II)